MFVSRPSRGSGKVLYERIGVVGCRIRYGAIYWCWWNRQLKHFSSRISK
jgi:hypothetical protein